MYLRGNWFVKVIQNHQFLEIMNNIMRNVFESKMWRFLKIKRKQNMKMLKFGIKKSENVRFVPVLP